MYYNNYCNVIKCNKVIIIFNIGINNIKNNIFYIFINHNKFK